MSRKNLILFINKNTTRTSLSYNLKYKKLDDSPIVVEQEGGVLEVHWDDSGSLKLVGPSEFEYEGTWDG